MNVWSFVPNQPIIYTSEAGYSTPGQVRTVCGPCITIFAHGRFLDVFADELSAA